MNLLELTIPDKPRSGKQRYCLTPTGRRVLTGLADEDKMKSSGRSTTQGQRQAVRHRRFVTFPGAGRRPAAPVAPGEAQTM